jgi:hypothetical protein
VSAGFLGLYLDPTSDDGRLATVDRADLANIESAQKRYQHISDTLDDAIAKLQQIVDNGSEGMIGQWVEPLKDDAKSIKDDLAKARTRYHDVAAQIAIYQPDLEHGKDQITAALHDSLEAKDALTGAKGLPDPQKGSDGKISSEEQQKGTDKQNAINEANGNISAAKNRLTAALDALDVSGKRLGDAVNCKNYDDGLTDSLKDKILAVFKMISKIFGVLALILTALAFLIPGVNLLVIGGIVAGAVLLISDTVLYANGEGDLSSVLLDAFGLGLGGLAAGIGKISGLVGDMAKSMGALKFLPALGAGGKVIPLVDAGGMLGGITKGPGFFGAMWNGLKDAGGLWKNIFTGGGFKAFFADYGALILDLGTFDELLSFGRGLGLTNWYRAWGGLNIIFNLGAGAIWGGFQVASSFSGDS